MPGVGMVFRSHLNANETYMLLRSGFAWRREADDRGPASLTLMSRGGVLLPFRPTAGAGGSHPAFAGGATLRFGDATSRYPAGWPDSNVLVYALGDDVDYAWTSTGYPAWHSGGRPDAAKPRPQPTDADTPAAGAFEWQRQVVFLKAPEPEAPSYFVIRDSTQGDDAVDRHLLLDVLGSRRDVKTWRRGLVYDSEWPVDLDLTFARPVQVETFAEALPVRMSAGNLRGRYRREQRRPAGERKIRLSRDWLVDGVLTKAQPPASLPASGLTERHVYLRVSAGSDEDFFWLLFPRWTGRDRPLKTEQPAPGVLKILGPRGIDYVFLDPGYIEYEDETVTFAGCGGAVRIRRDNVVMALCHGHGRVGYRGHVFEGTAPIQVQLPRSELKQKVRQISTRAPGLLTPDFYSGPAEQLAPGVTKRRPVKKVGSVVYTVDADRPLTYADETVSIAARRALVEVMPADNGIRFVAPDGEYVRLVCHGHGVRGLGPFDLTFTKTRIMGEVEGGKRTLVTTLPPAIRRPAYWQNGVRFHAGWADPGRQTGDPAAAAFALAFAVTEGRHEIRVEEWTYPSPPGAPPRRALRARTP